MIARLIAWSINNRPLVLLGAAFLVVAGIIAARATPVDAIPDLSDVQVIIRTPYAGQAPRVVEQQVTYPLSTAMLAVPKAKTVRGFSFFGDSFVYVIFDDGTDPYWARSRVLESLSQVTPTLPDGARPQLGPDATGVGWVYQYTLVDRSGRNDLAALTSLQNWFLKYELQTVPGVAEVATVGGMVRQYQVVVDPDRLRGYGIALSVVQRAIQRANQEVGGAVIEMAEAEYMVRATGYLESIEDLRAVPVRTTADGVVVRLDDIAEVRIGPQLRRGIADLNGEGEVVGGIIVMRHGGNAQATIDGVRERLDALRSGLPDGVEIVPVYDRSELIGKAIDTLNKTLIEELAIVALICAVFLFHIRSALVAVISLPIGIGVALLVMRAQGLNANIMSLGGIAIAIGAMVDGAIVMIENLHHHLAEPSARFSHRASPDANRSLPADSSDGGPSATSSQVAPDANRSLPATSSDGEPSAASSSPAGPDASRSLPADSSDGGPSAASSPTGRAPAMDRAEHWRRVTVAAQEVGPALFFSLAIITLSFLPVFTLQAQEGRLFAPLAYTKTYAMAAAAGLAVTLVPVLMGYVIRGRIRSESENPVSRVLTAAYTPVIGWVTRHPWSALIISALVAATAIWPATRLGSEFMPPLDEGDWMYMPTTRPGLSTGNARQLLQQTDKLIKSVPEVDTVFGKIGRAETATDPAPLTMIETTITFKPESEWRPGMTLESIRDEIRQRVDLPGVTNAWVMPIATRIDMLATGIKTPVGVRISGPELETIQAIGRELEAVLPQVPGTASVYSERVAGGRYVTIDIDRDAAGRLGLNIADVQDVVRSAVGGMTLTQTVEGRERYPVNLRYPQAWRDSPEALRELPIVTEAGLQITLGDVADIRIEDGAPMIKSENARPSGLVFVDIADRDVGSYVVEAQQLIAEELQLPAGYALHWSGQFEYMQRAEQRLMLVVPATLAVIALLLYLAFGAMRQVLIILATVPMALSGGVWLLYVLNYDLSVAVAVGFIALAGVAVEIGVVMLTYLNMARRSHEQARERGEIHRGSDARSSLTAAVRTGALRRLRPVVMTATATIAGLLPIMLSTGTGSEVMRRIAAPMVGGLVTTLILALVVLPAVYVLAYRGGAAGAGRSG